jgi:hypothetical protein
MSPKGRPQRARDVIDRSRTIRTPVPASDVALAAIAITVLLALAGVALTLLLLVG